MEDQSLCTAVCFARIAIHGGLLLLQYSMRYGLRALLLKTVQWAVQGKKKKGKKGNKTGGGAAQGPAPNKSSAFMDHPVVTLSPAAESPKQGAVVINVSLLAEGHQMLACFHAWHSHHHIQSVPVTFEACLTKSCC